MEPHTVRPRRFDQAQEVADAFKNGTPVIMNLEGTERDVARRLIDFGSGICYALDGTMEKVATGGVPLEAAGAAASTRLRRIRRLNARLFAATTREHHMDISPQRVRTVEFRTVKRGSRSR